MAPMSKHDIQGVAYRIPYDPDADETPTVALVRAVAAITGEHPRDLDPLPSVIDPEALDRVITHARTQSEQPLTVSFSWAGCEITASGDGPLQIHLPAD